jgi:hypothetical protein
VAKSTKPDDKKTMIDVAPPGKSAPSATSKPIIVGHGPMMKDPTITSTETQKPEEEAKAPSTSTPSQAKSIQPIAAPEEPDETLESAPEEASTTPEPTPVAPAAEPKTSIASNAIVDAVVDQAATRKRSDEAAGYDQDKVNQLIKDKTYFVKIHKPPRQSLLGVVLWVVLIVLLAAVGLIVARGLGVVDFSVPLLDDLVR